MNNYRNPLKKTIANYVFDTSEIIGSGYTSKVYKGINNSNNQTVAIKVISLEQLQSPISQSLLKSEKNILKKLDHPNLMKVFDILDSLNNTYMICEFCNEGDLASILQKNELNQSEIIEIFKQIASGVKALHDKKIIHRDLKPANILKSNGIFKLADFGFAIIENDMESIMKRFNVGTPLYMAPETVQYNIYSEKSDIWALGVILYQMNYNQLPFNSKNSFDIIKKHQLIEDKIKKDTKIEQSIKDLIIGMLNPEYEKRICIKQIFEILKKKQNKQTFNLIQNFAQIPLRIISSSKLSTSRTIESYINSKYILKSQPDEIIEKDYQENYQIEKKKISCHLVLDYEENQQKNTNEFEKFNDEFQNNNKDEVKIYHLKMSSLKNCSPLFKKQYINCNQINHENKEESECKQNSTNDTIKQIQLSNCQSLIDKNKELENKKEQILQKKKQLQQNKSPIRLVSSQKTIISSAIKTTQKNNNKNDTPNYYFAQKSAYPFNSNYSQGKVTKRQIGERATTEFSIGKQTSIDDGLSATIRPTYKFVLYLNQTLNNLEGINTEEKQKCYFLLKKLLAIKSQYICEFSPECIQEQLQCHINGFIQYFEKIQNIFYTSDELFEKHFNIDINFYSEEFSQLLIGYLQKQNCISIKEFLIIQEVINDNLKQNNQPILFARRWENDQF